MKDKFNLSPHQVLRQSGMVLELDLVIFVFVGIPAQESVPVLRIQAETLGMALEVPQRLHCQKHHLLFHLWLPDILKSLLFEFYNYT